MGIYYERLRNLLNEKHEFENKIDVLEKYSWNSLSSVVIQQVSNDGGYSIHITGNKISGESEAISTFIESLKVCYHEKIQEIDLQIAQELSKKK